MAEQTPEAAMEAYHGDKGDYPPAASVAVVKPPDRGDRIETSEHQCHRNDDDLRKQGKFDRIVFIAELKDASTPMRLMARVPVAMPKNALVPQQLVDAGFGADALVDGLDDCGAGSGGPGLAVLQGAACNVDVVA